MKATATLSALTSGLAFVLYGVAVVWITCIDRGPTSVPFMIAGVVTTLSALVLGAISWREQAARIGLSLGTMQLVLVCAAGGWLTMVSPQ